MPTANYSHMVMGMELMVDGDEGGEDGGEDGLRIPPPEEKSRINLTPKRRTWWRRRCVSRIALLSWGKGFFSYMKGYVEDRRRDGVRGPIGVGPRGQVQGPRGPPSFGPPAPSRAYPLAQLAPFPEKMAWYFSPI